MNKEPILSLVTLMCVLLGTDVASGQAPQAENTALRNMKTSCSLSSTAAEIKPSLLRKSVRACVETAAADKEENSVLITGLFGARRAARNPSGQGTAGAPAPASGDAAGLAKKLSNPVASLISVPFQNNFDFNMGSNDDGWRYTLNFQPVIPITLNKDWNLISRTIVPIMYQADVVGPNNQRGVGDIVQSFFFSPAKTEPFIWGFGPALLIPSATNDVLGAEKLGIGPTLVILKQQKGWTYGALMNHIWSVAGKESRPDVNATFLQPFLAYTTRTAWTFTLNTESTYDWTAEQWSVPANFQIAKLVRFGKQPVSFAAGPRYWANSPSGGPEGWGLRFVVTLLFPK